jgi:hypothetical protein
LPPRGTSLRLDHVATRFARTFPQLVPVPPRAGFTRPSISIDDLIFQERLPGPGEEDGSCHVGIISYPLCEDVNDRAKKDVFAAYCWFRRAHVELRCLTITGFTGGDFASEDTEKLDIRVRGVTGLKTYIGLDWDSALYRRKQTKNESDFTFFSSGLSRLGYVTPLRDGA